MYVMYVVYVVYMMYVMYVMYVMCVLCMLCMYVCYEKNKFMSYHKIIAVPFWSQHVCKVVSPIAHLDCNMNRIHNSSIWCDSLFLAPPYMSEQYRPMHAYLNLLKELIYITNMIVRGIQFALTVTFKHVHPAQPAGPG